MATIDLQHADPPTQGYRLFLWETVGDADQGIPAPAETFTDRSVQAVGTWDSATLVLQGSNDGTNWTTLDDLQGNAISMTADGLVGIAEPTKFIRPSTSGGQGSTDIDVYVFCVSRR